MSSIDKDLVEYYSSLNFDTEHSFLLNSIRSYIRSINSTLRTVTLPSDRVAKNFYEASGITARVLLMEEKRENNRYRP